MLTFYVGSKVLKCFKRWFYHSFSGFTVALEFLLLPWLSEGPLQWAYSGFLACCMQRTNDFGATVLSFDILCALFSGFVMVFLALACYLNTDLEWLILVDASFGYFGRARLQFMKPWEDLFGRFSSVCDHCSIERRVVQCSPPCQTCKLLI